MEWHTKQSELAASQERERVLQAEVRHLEIKESLGAKAGLALYDEHEALKERERVLREALAYIAQASTASPSTLMEFAAYALATPEGTRP